VVPASDRLVDGALVLVVLVAGLVQVWPTQLGSGSLDSFAGLARELAPPLTAIALALPLWFRRAHPVPTAGAVAVALGATALVGQELSTGPIALFVAIYSVARYESAPGISALVLLGALTVAGAVASVQGAGTEWLVFVVIVAVGLWGIGDAARRDEERASRLEEQAARHEAERLLAAERAVVGERARIAREIHDVIAHDVTVIVVHASAAARIVTRDPAEAQRSLEAIERTGREALVEVRRLLGVLHRDDAPPANDPVPSITRLGPLLDEIRLAGLPVDLRVDGVVAPLAQGVDVSSYRLIQEALTNSLRHAPSSRARVTLVYRPGSLEIEVANDGPPPAATENRSAWSPGTGRGLAGMRERVALLEGELEVGPLAEGGFLVRALLPLQDAS
jgi:signal transduction histidine kinase